MKSTIRTVLRGLFLCSSLARESLWISAFAMGRLHPTRTTTSLIPDSWQHRPSSTPATLTVAVRLRAGAQDDVPGDSFSELTSALAKLDKQQQRSKSRWSKLVLPMENEGADGDGDGDDRQGGSWSGDANAAAVGAAAAAAAAAIAAATAGGDYVWMLEPPAGRTPSCVIVFTGGAGLGQVPNVAYNELLTRVSDRLDALVLAAPYSVGLDHFQLAKQTGEAIRRALVYCQDDPGRPYMSADRPLPTFSLAHSLGCKLQTIYMLATRQDYLDGMGFMAYNNFSFARTLKMARAFTEELRKSTTRARMGDNDAPPPRSANTPFGGMDSESVISGIFDLAEMAAGAIGVDFSPNADDTDRLIQLRYDAPAQTKTRLFVFDDDNLHSSAEFLRACSGGSAEGSGPSVSGLPGGHLSPVYIQLKVDDVASGFDGDGMPPEAREMAKEAMGGFQGASFGDETTMNLLVDEICGWILGKPPTRGPAWAGDDNVYNNQEGTVPRISDGR